MNFEEKMLENVDIDRAYARALKVLARGIINPKDFHSVYNNQTIAADRNYVERMEKIFKEKAEPDQEKAQKLAAILEAIIFESTELFDWAGPDAFTIKVSRYDDIANGVDIVIELNENPAFNLAVDVTCYSEVDANFKRIKEEIEKGQLAKIRYFASGHTNIKSPLSKVPHVVVGANAKTIKELSDLWLSGEKKALTAHPIQFQILDEMMLQLAAFAEYADAVQEPELAKICRDIHELVEKIYTEKTKSLVDNGERDDVFYAIKDNVLRLFDTASVRFKKPVKFGLVRKSDLE